MKKMFILVIILSLLVGCNANNHTLNLKPDNVTQESWDKGLTYAIIINEFMKSGVKISEGTISTRIGEFANPDDPDRVSELEKKIFITIKEFGISAVSYQLLGGTSSKNRYKECVKVFEQIYGKNSLVIENVNNEIYDEVLNEYSDIFTSQY